MVTATLTATHDDSVVVLQLTVENDGTEPVAMQFSDTQRAEFVAADDGEEVWRWSAGQMFGQMLGSETLGPGEQTTFEGGWEDPPTGEYRVRGSLAATDVEASDEVTVEVE
mgnify:CR=1 FL=1